MLKTARATQNIERGYMCDSRRCVDIARTRSQVLPSP